MPRFRCLLINPANAVASCEDFDFRAEADVVVRAKRMLGSPLVESVEIWESGRFVMRVTRENVEKPSKTLGDVLYAQITAPVSERDWATLIQSIAAGDQLALHTLYGMSHRVVFTLILRITANRETAEELTIDVFHDVWRRASNFDPGNGTVLGWIMNQARSRAIDRLRYDNRKKRAQGEVPAELAEASPDPFDVAQLREQGDQLRAALAALTREERQAIEVTFFGELTHIEAATRLNLPLGTLKTRIRSGLLKLQRALGIK